MPEAVYIGNSFLSANEKLTQMIAPKLKTVGDSFLRENKDLTRLYLPKLEKAGICFIKNNEKYRDKNVFSLSNIN